MRCQPSVDFFLKFNVPVWYPWGPDEEVAAATNPHIARLAPLARHVEEALVGWGLQEPSAGPRVALSIEEEWAKFVEGRRTRREHRICQETGAQTQSRLAREKNPLVGKTTTVYEWELDYVESKYVRELVYKSYNRETLNRYGDAQKRYDSCFNKWHCCQDFGALTDDDYQRFEEEEEEENLIRQYDYETGTLWRSPSPRGPLPGASLLSEPRPAAPSLSEGAPVVSSSDPRPVSSPSSSEPHPAAPSSSGGAPVISSSSSYVPRPAAPSSSGGAPVISSSSSSVPRPATSSSFKGAPVVSSSSAMVVDDGHIFSVNGLHTTKPLIEYYSFVPPDPIHRRHPSPVAIDERVCNMVAAVAGQPGIHDQFKSTPLMQYATQFVQALSIKGSTPAVDSYDLAVGNCWYLGQNSRLLRFVRTGSLALSLVLPREQSLTEWHLTVHSAPLALFVCRLLQCTVDVDIALVFLQCGLLFNTLLLGPAIDHPPMF